MVHLCRVLKFPGDIGCAIEVLVHDDVSSSGVVVVAVARVVVEGRRLPGAARPD